MATTIERRKWGEWLDSWDYLLDPTNIEELGRFLLAFEIELKEGALGKFVLNEVQEMLNAVILELEDQSIPVRILVLKARQMGITTFAGGRALEKCSRHAGQKCVIMADNEDNTAEIYQSKVMELWEQIPEQSRPLQLKSTRRELVVRHGAREQKKKKRPKKRGRSYVRVLTAGAKTGGRSRTLQHLHLSEAAFFKNAHEVMNATFQTVPYKQGTSIIVETTANGASGAYYDMWKKAERGQAVRKGSRDARSGKDFEIPKEYRGEKMMMRCYRAGWKSVKKEPMTAEEQDVILLGANEWVPIFFPWFAFSEYSRPFRREEEVGEFKGSMSVEEIAVQEQFGLTLEQMNWRRWAIENLCLGDPLLFQQEYPATPDEAFVASGTCRFDKRALKVLESRAPEPISRGTVLATTEGVKFIEDHQGIVTLYRTPNKKRSYIIGADTAEGLTGNAYDFSAACVYDRKTRKLMARVHGQVDTRRYADLLYYLGRWYNRALIVPENNSIGLAVIDRLMHRGYPNVYFQRVLDSATQKHRDKLGFTTTGQSRDFGLTMLAAEISRLRMELSIEQIRECHAFVTDDGKRWEAKSGDHDDEVMAMLFVAAVNHRETYEEEEEAQNQELPLSREDERLERHFRRVERSLTEHTGYEDPFLGTEW